MKVLNAGYVELVEYMGGDEGVIRNARRCWQSEDRSSERSDINLIRHLIKAGHKTPFEAMVFTFDVKCPIFIARQWMRHRMGSYSEISMRYCVADEEYFIPSGLSVGQEYRWVESNQRQFRAYYGLLDLGYSKEQARSVLPQGMYTKFYWTVNGNSLMNFLMLRTDKAAQKEIREYANAILKLAKSVAPVSLGTFEKEVLKSD